MDHLRRHLRHAFALLVRERRVTLTAVLTMGLAIGANTALFSVLKAVLLTPLPYTDPERLVMIWKTAEPGETTWLSLREVVEYAAGTRALERIDGYTDAQANFTDGDRPERVPAAGVTPGLFQTLGVPAALGRTFAAADGASGAEPTVVLGHGLWQRRFGSDPSWIGRTVAVNGVNRTVLGVMPEGFRLPRDFSADRPTEAWIPVTVDPGSLGAWGNRSYVGVARLRPGVTVAAATADLHLAADRWVQAGFLRDNGDGALHRDALPLGAFVTGNVRGPLLVLLAAVVAVLLIACANVANLLLARADVRQREIAMRTALGASRIEIVRQLLVESVTLAALGGLLGVGLALAAGRAFVAVSAATLPRAGGVAIDPLVLGFSTLLTIGSGLLFGALPAWRLSRRDLVAALNDGGRSGTAGAGRHAFRRSLVVAQLAGSVVLLVVAVLLVRSLIEMSRIDLGFDDRQVLTAQVQLPATEYPQPADVVRFYRELTDRLANLPGVEAAGAVRVLPLSRTIGDWSISIEGRPVDPNENPNGDFQAVTPGYFEAMRLSVVRGRALRDADREGAPIAAVINETMASRYWPGQDALGRRFRMGTAEQPWATIVGIVRQVRHNAVVEPPRAEMYFAHAQLPDEIGSAPRGMAIVLRTSGDPVSLAGGLSDTVRAMDRRLPVADVRPMREVAAQALAGPRFTAVVLGVFAVVALVIASVGIYGTIALLVSERAQELGIRLALGAAPSSIFRMVVGQGAALAAVGIGLGLIGAVLAARSVATMLYGVRAFDAITFVAVPVTLGLVTLAACAGPARRATRVDPVATLRR